MRYIMSELSRPLIASGAALAASFLLTGCIGSGSENPKAPNTAASPQTNPSAEALASAIATPDVELIATPIQPTEAGELKDLASRYVYEVSKYSATAEEVRKSRNLVSGLPAGPVKTVSFRAVDSKLASNTTYTPEIYTYDDSVLPTTNKAISHIEAIVDMIADPKIKKTAELSLDYTEAKLAVEAMEGTTPAPKIAESLTANVENATVKALGQKAAGGDMAAKEKLEADAKKSVEAVEALDSESFAALYYGSNSHARNINKDIIEFTKARAQD